MEFGQIFTTPIEGEGKLGEGRDGEIYLLLYSLLLLFIEITTPILRLEAPSLSIPNNGMGVIF
jgi:hypothetical protein